MISVPGATPVICIVCRWTLWLIANQENMAKVMGCDFHDFVMFYKTLSWEIGKTLHFQAATCHIVTAYEEGHMAGNCRCPLVPEDSLHLMVSKKLEPSISQIQEKKILETTWMSGIVL